MKCSETGSLNLDVTPEKSGHSVDWIWKIKKSPCIFEFMNLYSEPLPIQNDNLDHRSNVFVLTNFICWNLIPNMMIFGGGALGRWLGHKGGALMNGIFALVKEAPKSSLILLIMWGHGKMTAVCQLGGWLSPDSRTDSTFILDFPPSRTVTNAFLCFISNPVYDILLKDLKQTKTFIIYPEESWNSVFSCKHTVPSHRTEECSPLPASIFWVDTTSKKMGSQVTVNYASSDSENLQYSCCGFKYSRKRIN